jgi:acyl-CoA reductase-like NAD-dependent aldehyde dehydrogenase
LEVLECADFTEYFVRIAPDALSDKQIAVDSNLWPSKNSVVSREPIGVVAIIKPWNYPIEMIMWALVPALLSGNTVVVKPSEKSPASAFLLAELLHSAGLPKGVINFVFGDKATGRSLILIPEVRMVSFTGSVASGRQVSMDAAPKLKKVALELGGNDAAIVCPDADLELAANGLVWGAFCNAGQVCVGVKRAYIHTSVYSEIKKLIVNKTQALRRGDDYGPMIDLAQVNTFEKFLDDAREKRNNVLVGGEREEVGYFVRPAVIEVQNETTDILKSECFGPLLPLIEVGSVDDAVEAANSSDYGLGASVWTRDLVYGQGIAKRLQVGMVWINDINIAFPEAPWGGTKNSGIGFELSPGVFDEYTLPKHISTEMGGDPTRAWWYPY